MKSLITLWKLDPLYPNPFSPVHRALKFSHVLGTTSALRVISIRPAGDPPMVMSKKQTGLAMVTMRTFLARNLIWISYQQRQVIYIRLV